MLSCQAFLQTRSRATEIASWSSLKSTTLPLMPVYSYPPTPSYPTLPPVTLPSVFLLQDKEFVLSLQ